MLKASKHEAIFKIRFPLRVVEDYYVDRLQVYNRNVEPSNTNCPIAFFTALWYYNVFMNFFSFASNCLYTVEFLSLQGFNDLLNHLGGYSDRVPPLPIPNREVKPVHVDGTAIMWESR